MEQLGGRMRWARCLLAVALLAGTAAAAAANLRVRVEAGAAPVADAVLSLHSTAAAAAARRAPPVGARLDQREGQFVPRVLPVTTGTRVDFPNSDKVRHHVYSFSPTKRFELPLFGESGAAPVLFDRAGVATLGCNIHDWMVAYVVVLDTPYFARSGADGVSTLTAPEGDYELQVWHPGLPAAGVAPRRVSLTAATPELQWPLPLAPTPPSGDSTDPRLRELQEKFRGLERGR